MKLLLQLTAVLLLFFNSLHAFQGETYIFEGPEGSWTDESLWKDGLYPGTNIVNGDAILIRGKMFISEEVTIINNGSLTIMENSSGEEVKNEIQLFGSLLNEEKGKVLLKDFTQLILRDQALLTNNGSIEVSHYCNIKLQDSNTNLTNKGSILFSFEISQTASLINNGTITNKSMGDIRLGFSSLFENNNTLINEGTFFIGTQSDFINNAEIYNKDSFRVVNTEKFVNTETGSFINSGNFDSSSGLIENSGNWNNVPEDQTSSGTLSLSGRFSTFLNNGSLKNQPDGRNFRGVQRLEGSNESHIGQYVNRTIIAPGNKNELIGRYTFTDELIQESFASIHIDINNNISDQIISLSDIKLNGSLEINVLNDLNLSVGESIDYTILTANNISGEFNEISFSEDLLEYRVSIIYNKNSTILKVTKTQIYIFEKSEGLWTNAENWRNGVVPNTSISDSEIIVINGKAIISDDLNIVNRGQIILNSTVEDGVNQVELEIIGSLLNEDTGSLICKDDSNLLINFDGNFINDGEILLMNNVKFHLLSSNAKFINNGQVLDPNARTQKSILNNGEIINTEKSLFYVAFLDSLTNNGKIINFGDFNFDSNSNIINSGIIENEGEISVEFGVSWFNAKGSSFNNKGMLEGTRLNVTNNGNWINEESSLAKINLDEIQFENNGIIDDYDANNTFTGFSTSLSGVNQGHLGDYLNSTLLSPGGENQVIGSYAFTNNYEQNSDGVLEVQITGRVSDLLTSQTNISLSGSLEVEMVEPIFVVPNSFLDYKIIEGNSISGEFDNIKVSDLPENYRYEIISSQQEIKIRVFNDSETMLPFIFFGDGSWTDVGNWENEKYPGIEIKEGQEVIVSGRAIINEQVKIENNGSISIVPNLAMPVSSQNGSLIVRGVFTNQIEAQIALRTDSFLELSGSGILENKGNIEINRKTLIKLNDIESIIINEGKIKSSNQSSVGSNFLNEGTILNQENGVIIANDLQFNNNNYFENLGSFGITSSEIQNKGTMITRGGISLENSNLINFENGNLTNSGDIYANNFVSISNEGTLTITDTGNIDITELVFFNHISGGVFINNGALNIFSGDAFMSEDFTNNGKIVIVQEDSQSGGGQMTIRSEAILTNYGEIAIAPGNGTNNIIGGNLISEGGNLTNENEGLITNEGRIIQDEDAVFINKGSFLVNNSSHSEAFVNESGTLGLGVSSEFVDASRSTYTYTLTNGWEQEEEGTLQIRILGSTSDKVVSPAGTVTLSGKLEVNFAIPFNTIDLSEEYIIVEAENIIGTFKNLNVFNLPENKNFEVIYTNTEVRLKLEDNRVLNTPDNPFSEIKLVTDLRKQEIHLRGLQGKHKLSIYDLHGRKVIENKTTAPFIQNISGLAKGSYILKLDREGAFYRFVK